VHKLKIAGSSSLARHSACLLDYSLLHVLVSDVQFAATTAKYGFHLYVRRELGNRPKLSVALVVERHCGRNEHGDSGYDVTCTLGIENNLGFPSMFRVSMLEVTGMV